MAVPQSLKDARTALRSKRDETARKLFARETARQNLEAATRQFAAGSSDLAAAQAAFDTAQNDLATARTNETAARNALNGAITSWLTIPGTQTLMEPDADYARMSRTTAPVVLFPLRLETRFDLTARTLRVRIYPDEILSDMHERELTPTEQQAGADYWNGIPGPDQSGQFQEDVSRWTTIAKRFGVPRAAYIVRATTPGATLPPPRPTTPSRAAEAVLPDRWVAFAFKNGELRKMRKGLPIPEPLTLTPDPSDDAPTFIEVADTFTAPTSVAWTVRYDEALKKGMAIDIDGLADDEVATGFDRVIVLGVKTSMEPEDATNFIADLFDAHHYTRGLDLVPQGTPTNNVPGQPTPFTMTEPTGAESFEIERLGPDDGDINFNPDFSQLATLFGFDDQFNVFRFLGESILLRRDIEDGKNMRRVLWASTLGYFMSQMMNPEPFLNGDTGANPIFPDATVARAKDFFLTFVSAQGPAPAFRVGAVPYGLLPAVAVSRMVASAGEDAAAIAVMSRLVPYWRSATGRVPTVQPTSANRNLDLMKVISQKSHSDGAFIRNSVGVQTVTNLLQLAVQDVGAALSALGQLANPVLATLGHREWAAARIFGLTFLSAITRHAGPLVTAHPKNGGLVTAIANPDPAHPEEALNYLALLGNTTLLRLDTIRMQGFMPNVAPPSELIPLLYLLARHSLLLEVVEVGRRVLAASFAAHKRLDLELWNITVNETGAPVFDVLSSRPTSSAPTVFEQIRRNVNAQNGILDSTNQYADLAAALNAVSRLPVRDLDRLTMETLDIASHRLDAWVTALATRRLVGYRTSESAAKRAPTNYFGGYGFVEDVRPVPRTTRAVTGLGNVDVQPNNGGFIHAPSLRHATAAAILRSGRMAEKSSPTRYAIELPSERARRARSLIDGVREGQALGGLLGFELESGLRARALAQNIAGMEGYILALRKLYPQVANKSGLDAGLSADRIAARNVMDGKLVRDAAAKPPGIPFGTGGLPNNGTPAQSAISNEVARLDEIMDAVGDLVMSEAVYQIAAGDVVSAEAAMNFLPQGSNPPEPEIASSPSEGVAVNHRVALVLEGQTHAPAPGWTPGASPRAAADPFVEAWVGTLLGNPGDAKATINYQLAGPQTASFSLDQLHIGALDFLGLAQSTSAAGQHSPLDRMIETSFLSATPGATEPVITYDTPAAPGRSIPQIIELARALGAVLGGAREFSPIDLRRADDGVDETLLTPTATDLVSRAKATITALATVRDALGGTNVKAALLDAAAYLADAFPDPNATAAQLNAAAIGAKAELARRVTEAQGAVDGADASTSAPAKIAVAVTALRTMFGRNTLVVLPAAVPQGGDELGQSLSALKRPINFTDPSTFDPHQAPGRFLQQASRVREQLGPWRRFTSYAGAFGAAAPLVSVAQLPFVAGEDWAGRATPAISRTSLVLVSADGQTNAPDPKKVWRGLLLDQWAEIVPSGKARTALAFHYDSQNAEAPQVILMAMHSGQPGGWNQTELYSIVNETMDLAQTRPVDSDVVALGQLVPPICVASNSENNVVSTTFGPEARQAPPVVG